MQNGIIPTILKVKHLQRMSARFYYPGYFYTKWSSPLFFNGMQGMFIYVHQCPNYVAVSRLGEVCLHITVLTLRMINAREACQQTGADSCISTLCGWSHCACEVRIHSTSVAIMWWYPVMVKPAFSSEKDFKGCNTRKSNASLHWKQHCW